MGRGNENVFTHQCHMTKMAAMPIYGKNHYKTSITSGLISTKLGR